MTDYIPFQPPQNDTFRFSAVVNGQSLFMTVWYNAWSRRYFLRSKDGGGEIISDVPMVGSPENADINLVLPLAPGKIVYRGHTGNFEVSPE